MKFIKPHNEYGNIMSVYITIFKTQKYIVQIQEYYDPHYFEVYVWKKDVVYGVYELYKSIKVPLNKYAYLVIKLGKVDSQAIKLRAQLDNLIERRKLVINGIRR